MTDRPRYPRRRCLVPFCRRTSTLFPADWICGEHWRLVSPHLRRRHHKLRRLYLKAVGSSPIPLIRRLLELFERNFDRIKRQAIERAGGIG